MQSVLQWAERERAAVITREKEELARLVEEKRTLLLVYPARNSLMGEQVKLKLKHNRKLLVARKAWTTR